MGTGIKPKIFYNRCEHVHLYTFDVVYLVEDKLLFGLVNVTFNNISAISWRSVLLVEETGVPGENHRPVASH